MRTWVRRILVFLLLGAIVNVAVAWGCVLFASRRKPVEVSRGFSGTPVTLMTLGEPHVGVEVLSCDGVEQELPMLVWNERVGGWTEYQGDIRSDDWARTIPATRTRAGWPCLALEGWQAHSFGWLSLSPEQRPHAGDQTHCGLALNDGSDLWLPRRRWILPLRPVIRGFAVNSLVYGSILLAVGLTRVAVRASMRKRHGLCPACAYPRGSSPVCTECGEALPAARLARRD